MTTPMTTPKLMTAAEVYKSIVTKQRAEKEKLRELANGAILIIQKAMLEECVFERKFEYSDFSIQTGQPREVFEMELAALGYQVRHPIPGGETIHVIVPKVATPRSPVDLYQAGSSGRRSWDPSGPPEADVLDP